LTSRRPRPCGQRLRSRRSKTGERGLAFPSGVCRLLLMRHPSHPPSRRSKRRGRHSPVFILRVSHRLLIAAARRTTAFGCPQVKSDEAAARTRDSGLWTLARVAICFDAAERRPLPIYGSSATPSTSTIIAAADVLLPVSLTALISSLVAGGGRFSCTVTGRSVGGQRSAQSFSSVRFGIGGNRAPLRSGASSVWPVGGGHPVRCGMHYRSC